MTKYHIDKNGLPAVCKAKKRPCPLGGDDVHFDSIDEAQAYADKQNEAKFGLFGTQRKVRMTAKGLNDVYINYSGSTISDDNESLYEMELSDPEDVADYFEASPLVDNMQEYVDDLMTGYETITDEKEKEKFHEAVGYDDWVATTDEEDKSMANYLYGDYEFELEQADYLYEVNDGKVDVAYELTSYDDIADIAGSVESYLEEDSLEQRNYDYRRMSGF